MIGATAPQRADGGAELGADTVAALLRRYADAGAPLSCVRVAEGLLNRGYRLTTTRGRFFLKHHLDGDPAVTTPIGLRHRAVGRLAAHGLPAAAPLPDAEGRTAAVVHGFRCALYPWVDGRHRQGAELSLAESVRLGALLGQVHVALDRVMPPGADPERCLGERAADPAETDEVIAALLARVRARPRPDPFDALAEHRLRERRVLLRRCADRRPPPGAEPVAGWVHGDFHPLNVLYAARNSPPTPARSARPELPVAIVDWDRLSVRPRAEEAVRAALIFFVRPDGSLDLPRAGAYARGYRTAAGAPATELAAAVHRLWWERLNDFWMLRWRYELHDRRADPLFAASSALVPWWTRHYEEVYAAFSSPEPEPEPAARPVPAPAPVRGTDGFQ